MRPKLAIRTASKDSYTKFCEKNPNIHITFEQYKKILYTYNSYIITYLLETGNALKLPFGLGIIAINKYKPKRVIIDHTGQEKINLSIDWQETKKQGKKVYHMNYHTEGYNYHWMWLHAESRIRFSIIWKFEIARVHSRMLKTYLKKPNSKYKDIYKDYGCKKYSKSKYGI